MSESDSNWQVPPNEILARVVAETLGEKRLIGEAKVDVVTQKLRTGKASESDWLAWAEDTLARQEGEKHASTKD
jgi:hypothetical protein